MIVIRTILFVNIRTCIVLLSFKILDHFTEELNVGNSDEADGLGSVQHCLAAATDIAVLSTLFFSQNQNVASYQTLKKTIPSPLKLR